MPTAPGFADVSVEFTHSLLPRPAYITFGVDPTATDPAQVATSVSLALNTAGSLLSLVDSNVTMSGIRVSLGTDGSEDLVYDAQYTIACTKSGASTPPNVAVLVHKNTARGGRRGRGRFFIPWAWPNTQMTETGIIAAADVTTMQNACTTFLSALATQTVPMQLLHGPGQTAPGAPNQVLSLTVDRLISTQRRRLGR